MYESKPRRVLMCVVTCVGMATVPSAVAQPDGQQPFTADAGFDEWLSGFGANERFFTKVDLDQPELVAVRDAVDAGDWARAAEAFLTRFRERETPKWYLDPAARPEPTGATDAPAERVLRREYRFVGKPGTLSRDIDWNADPHRDVEWPIELNRHYTWVVLCRAHWNTGNRRYLDDFRYQLADWLRDNPRPANRAGSKWTWRTLECGIRLMGSWPQSLYRVSNSPEFTAGAFCAMLRSTWEQADFLLNNPSGGGNWLVAESTGLLTAAVLFPELSDAAEWRETALARLSREMDRQVLPDGAQAELSPHYHSATLSSLQGAMRIATHNGLELPDNFRDGIERMFDYLAYVAKPDGRIPMFNDSDHDDAHARLRRESFDTRPDLRYIATTGKEGKPPERTSVALPWAGQYIMRSGWDTDAHYLAFDAGPFGLGHQHEDKLQIDVHALGRSHILDPGRYTYARSPWRSYFVSTFSHSTMLVDGRGQNRRSTARSEWVAAAPLPNRWLSTDAFDFAVGSYDDGFGGAAELVHIRKIFFVRGEYWIVHDLLIGANDWEGTHTADIQFQFGAAGARYDADTQIVSSENDDANLALIPVSGRALTVEMHEGEEDPPKGWVAWSLHRAWKEPATMAVLRQVGPVPLVVDTIMFPYRGRDRPSVKVTQLPGSGTDASRLRIATDVWEDTYTCRHAISNSGSDTQPGNSDSELTWVRRDLAGTVIRAASAGQTSRPAGATAPVTSLDIEGRDVPIHCPVPGTLVVDYGYADGGGYLFSQSRKVGAGDHEIALTGVKRGFNYEYRISLAGADGAAMLQRGRIHLPEPDHFDFDDGKPRGWGGNVSVQNEGADGTAHSLVAKSVSAGEGPVYAGTDHAIRLRAGPGMAFAFQFRFRFPIADGGDWCYAKLTLTDRDGMDWSAYFAEGPVADWKAVRLTFEDFRGDTANRPDQQGTPLPDGKVMSQMAFIARKGKTDQALPVEFSLDQFRLFTE